MSQTESPIRAMFDAQRTAIKQGRQAAKQGLAFQRNTGKMTASLLRGQESFQRQWFELTQAAIHGSVDATQALTGMDAKNGRQLAAIDDMMAQLKDTHSEFFGVLEREMDRSVNSMDDLSREYVEALEEGTDQLLESHRTIEDETVRNAEEFSEGMLDQLERTQTVLDQMEDQFERQTERTEQLFERQIEGAEEYQQQLEEEAEEMQRQLRKSVTAVAGGGGSRGGQVSELEEIDGLGETFRDRLADAGIHDPSDLADSDPGTVASAAEVSEDRARNWIEQAS